MTSTDLSERYGAPPAWRRPLVIGVAALVCGAALVWLVWATAFHSDPDVESDLVGFEVAGEQETHAELHVRMAEGVEATCRLRAYAEDHTTVGELAFTPVPGVNDVTIRTERRATTVEKLGCTSPDQNRPR